MFQELAIWVDKQKVNANVDKVLLAFVTYVYRRKVSWDVLLTMTAFIKHIPPVSTVYYFL